jgi:hypothetical protein
MERRNRNRFIPFLIGGGAAFGLLAFYMGIMTLTGDWGYAQFQFEQYRWWIIGLSIGLGIQSTLFVMIKRNLAGREKKAVRSTLAASGGVSTASMVACCAHHITDLVPVLGFFGAGRISSEIPDPFLLRGSAVQYFWNFCPALPDGQT